MSDAASSRETHASHPLDRVAWNALTSQQKHFAVGNAHALRFPSVVAPFAAIIDTSPASFQALRALIETQGPSALVTPGEIPLPAGLTLARHAPLLQMIWQGETSPVSTCDPVKLTPADVPDMLALVAAAQPGPFSQRTLELGDYLGIRKQGKLAAMAGERMKLDGYTEISAVCVDAAFRGQGLAAGLMKLLIASIRARGETPFLHVLASNHAAIALYRTLGFTDRRLMQLNVLGVSDHQAETSIARGNV